MNRLLAVSSLALLLAACSPASEAPAPAESTPAASAPVAAEPAAAAAPADPAAAACAIAAEPAPVAADGSISHPRLAIATLDDGCFDLAQQRGSWVVVNFWATWCKPCLKEIPDLTAFDAARDDVRVIGLAYEEIEPAAMREFLVDHPAGYPVALLDVYAPPVDFDTPRGLPMTYLIGPDGAIAKKFLGPITSAELETAIAEAKPL
jgi:thiol-disulfide isomerase/thioredoxin